MHVFPKKVTLLFTAKQNVQYTTQFVTVSLCCVSLQQKAKEKRNHYGVIEQNALRNNYMGNIINVRIQK